MRTPHRAPDGEKARQTGKKDKHARKTINQQYNYVRQR